MTDTVEGFVRAAECEQAVGQTINLGTSTEVSIGDLVTRIGAVLGRKLQVRKDAIRQRPEGSEVERLLSDNSLARSLMGWQPQVALDDGLGRTVAWISSNLELYRVGRYEV